MGPHAGASARAAEIVFVGLPEAGHLLPTFRIARTLHERGHRVRYLVPPDLRSLVESQGLAVESWFDDLHPSGYRDAEAAMNVVARRRAITARHRAMIHTLLADRGPAAELLTRPADLLFVDVAMPHLALWAARRRVPFVVVSTSLPQTRDEVVAPQRSLTGPAGTAEERHQVRSEWRRFMLKRRVSALAAGVIGATPPYALIERMARQIGLPDGRLDTAASFLPQVTGVPELVLCPQPFDFVRHTPTTRHYVESWDPTRVQVPAAPLDLPADAQVLYCSLGSQVYRGEVTPAFFRSVIDAVRARPERHLIMAVGDHLDPASLGALPANVKVTRRAPQLDVLARADVMITHGGLGSVKECIMNAVPMLVVPLAVDQPGNAARVRHHGLGLVGDVDTASARSIGDQLDLLLGQPAFGAAARAMRDRFVDAESRDAGADLVESWAFKGTPHG